MYEYTLGYECENGEIIKVTKAAFTKENAYYKALIEIQSYPYFLNHEFNESRLIKN